MTEPTPEVQPDASPLETLHEAIQTFVNAINSTPKVVGYAVVIWEEVRFDDDGDQLRRLSYAATGGATLASSIGLASAGLAMIERDAIADDGGDEE